MFLVEKSISGSKTHLKKSLGVTFLSIKQTIKQAKSRIRSPPLGHFYQTHPSPPLSFIMSFLIPMQFSKQGLDGVMLLETG